MSSPAVPATAVAMPAVAAPEVPATRTAPRCDNCGAAVSARYCGACGQRLEPPVHSLWHFARVATEDLTHADSRLWRTLAALLFKPGYLTAQFLAGRRASYLPPVRLYLVLSVAFFLYAAATQPGPYAPGIHTQGRGATVAPLSRTPDSPLGPARPGESAQQRADRQCSGLVYTGPWQRQFVPLLRRACYRIVEDDGRSLGEAFLHNVPRAMFLFLPLLAGAMMLMYWWPRHYYVEHLLLFVHNHAFAFLLLMLAGACAALLPAAASWVRLAAALYIPWYLYRSMRVVYGQGRALTIAKFVTLAFFYLVSGSLMVALTTLYSALTL